MTTRRNNDATRNDTRTVADVLAEIGLTLEDASNEDIEWAEQELGIAPQRRGTVIDFRF